MEVQGIARRQGPEVGQVIDAGAREHLVMAEVGSLQTEPRDLREMAVVEDPKEGTETEVAHQISLLNESQPMVRTLDEMTQIHQ